MIWTKWDKAIYICYGKVNEVDLNQFNAEELEQISGWEDTYFVWRLVYSGHDKFPKFNLYNRITHSKKPGDFLNQLEPGEYVMTPEEIENFKVAIC